VVWFTARREKRERNSGSTRRGGRWHASCCSGACRGRG
jgi:hypothetical protein